MKKRDNSKNAVYLKIQKSQFLLLLYSHFLFHIKLLSELKDQLFKKTKTSGITLNDVHHRRSNAPLINVACSLSQKPSSALPARFIVCVAYESFKGASYVFLSTVWPLFANLLSNH